MVHSQFPTIMEDQANNPHNIILISYHCNYTNETRLSFMKSSFEQCDFLFLQEHGFFKSQFDWFDKLGNGVGKHAVTAMEESVLFSGRPYGRTAIVWNKDLKLEVRAIQHESKRVCNG